MNSTAPVLKFVTAKVAPPGLRRSSPGKPPAASARRGGAACCPKADAGTRASEPPPPRPPKRLELLAMIQQPSGETAMPTGAVPTRTLPSSGCTRGLIPQARRIRAALAMGMQVVDVEDV